MPEHAGDGQIRQIRISPHLHGETRRVLLLEARPQTQLRYGDEQIDENRHRPVRIHQKGEHGIRRHIRHDHRGVAEQRSHQYGPHRYAIAAELGQARRRIAATVSANSMREEAYKPEFSADSTAVSTTAFMIVRRAGNMHGIQTR
jgi:hypothetical protein